MDLDEKDAYKYVEEKKEIPKEDVIKSPVYAEKENKMDFDEGGFVVHEKGEEVPRLDQKPEPEKLAYATYMDYDKEQIDGPVIDKDDKIKPEIKDDKMDKDKNDIKIEPPTQIEWAGALEKNRIYVRFSTTANKNEGERRYSLSKKVFPNVVGVKKRGKYILYVGPIEEDEIDNVIKKVRNYGFKDAYIIKE